MTKTLIHGANADCPDVQAGRATRCHGHHKRTSMTRDEQERWVIQYLAANLSREEIMDGERSITIQAFGDFFAAQWPRTFNRMQFASQVRRAAEERDPLHAPPWPGSDPPREPSVQLFDRMFTLPRRAQ